MSVDAFNKNPKKGLDQIIGQLDIAAEDKAEYAAAQNSYNDHKDYIAAAKAVVSTSVMDAIDLSAKMTALETSLGITSTQSDDLVSKIHAANSAQVTKDPALLKKAVQELDKAESAITEASKKQLEQERQKIIDSNAGKIAAFFHQNHTQLNLHTLGECLGEPQNSKILNAYADQMQFQGKEFGTAFREFVSNFQMPGESQKIDKIMEAFGKAYSGQNPDLGISADAAHRSAFVATIFNSDLHNPAVKQKRDFASYIGDFKDIDIPVPASNPATMTKDEARLEFFGKLFKSIKDKKLEISVSQVIPGYEISASSKSKDTVFEKVNNLFGRSQTLERGRGNFKTKEFDVTNAVKTIFPDIGVEKATIDKPRSWLKRLMGYEGKINITSKDEQGKDVKVTMQFYQPNVFSRSKTQRLIVQPEFDRMHPLEKSLDNAAKITSKFTGSTVKIEATYDYSKEEMSAAIARQKPQIKASKTHQTWVQKAKSLVGKKGQSVKLHSW